MISLLNRIFYQLTLGVNIFKPKTLIKWLSELSQKFHFLLSYWQPAYSYGQTLTPHTHLSLQESQIRMFNAFQVPLHGQTVQKRKKPTSLVSTQKSKRVLSSFIDSISVEKYRIRLFNGLYTFWENKRLRWGMLLLLLIAPLAKFFYLVLPVDGFGNYLVNFGPVSIINFIETESWYYINLHYYFFSIGELLTPAISTLGIFLLFPKKYYPSYLVGVPFGYFLMFLTHRNILFFYNIFQLARIFLSIP
jgi:hypothetical protein